VKNFYAGCHGNYLAVGGRGAGKFALKLILTIFLRQICEFHNGLNALFVSILLLTVKKAHISLLNIQMNTELSYFNKSIFNKIITV
jgi:hypothetical protein